MAKAKNRNKPDGYTERHHILPRSMNGSDDPSNLVDLTAREHFVAHMMWAKVYGGNQWYSVNVMTHGRQGKYYPNSRLFEIARKNAANQKSIDMKAKNPNEMDGVKEKQSKNNCMYRADVIARKSGENHPRRKNPEKWAHLKGVKRQINAPKGIDHHNSKKIKCVETGEIFDCIMDAVRKVNGNSGNLTTGLQKGKMRYGFHWQYV
jgi:hypothetical protein